MSSKSRQAFASMGYKYAVSEGSGIGIGGRASDSQIEYNRMVGTKYSKTSTPPCKSRKHRKR